MAIQCGIVGLPNVGKSTLFNALTAAGIAAENYPFCTIDPNVGVVPVPDARLQQLAAIAGSEKILPATVEFVDIAGPRGGRVEGRGPRQQVPRQHPRDPRHRPRGALLRERRRGARRRPHRSDPRHRGHQHRAAAGRPGGRREGGRQVPRRPPRPARRRTSRGATSCRSSAPTWTPASRRAPSPCRTSTGRRSPRCSCSRPSP